MSHPPALGRVLIDSAIVLSDKHVSKVWADSFTTQVRNRRVTKWVTFRGESKPLPVWCELRNMPYYSVHSRLLRGWDPEQAFTVPCKTYRAKLPANWFTPNNPFITIGAPVYGPF